MKTSTEERDYWTLAAMEKWGGSFIVCLAELAHHADPANFARIKTTWPRYWGQYERLGRKLQLDSKQ